MLRPTFLLLVAALASRGVAPHATATSGTRSTPDDVEFERDVRPILEANCTSCHGPEKKKGRLRLDRRSGVFKKDREDWLVEPGDPGASELYRRITLPVDDLDVMPPEEPFLGKADKDVLRRWIEQGAVWPEDPTADEEPDASEEGGDALALDALDPSAREAADASIAAIRARGGLANPIAVDAVALDVNLSLLREPATDADLDLLAGLEPALVWLELGRSAITDAGLAKLGGLRELRRLQLQETAIGDAGVAHLVQLPKLEVLNLYGTRVTDAALASLAAMPSLKRVYLWRTAVTKDAVAAVAREGLTLDTGWEPEPESTEPVSFADVRPILAANCFACHGPDEAAREAGLRLDTRDGATALREDGSAAVVPGDASASTLIQRITHGDERKRMPPVDVAPRLSQSDIDALRRWIDAGAEVEQHWSFEPPKNEAPPEPPQDAEGESSAKVEHPIDAFVAARLAESGLAALPEADRHTLARRASLDLRGLPPTPAEVAAFVNDGAPGAYERMLDRYLADPAFGERWAAVWLDLARYADTRGYEKDARRTIWPYRDWVIRAINDDMPFDRFTIEQLAGDLVDGGSEIATAFHRNTMTNDEGGTDDEEFRAAAVVDRVNTTMQLWMGVTAACAQCHSHKYDPISQEEYFRLYAVFDQTQDADRGDDAPLALAPSSEQEAQLAALEAELRDAEDAVAACAEAVRAAQGERVEGPSDVAADDARDTAAVRVSFDGEDRGAWLAGDGALDDGIDGRAGAFDGARAFAAGDPTTAGDFERDQPFSFAVWVRRDGDGVHVPIARMDSPAAYRGWDLYMNGGKVWVHLVHTWPSNCITIESVERVPAGEWTHLAVTYDGSSKAAGLKLFRDGRPMATVATHDSLSETMRTERPLLIGQRHGEGAMLGRVDDALVFDRRLTDDDVRELVRASAGRLALAIRAGTTDDDWRAPVLDRLVLADDDGYCAASARATDARKAIAAVQDAIPSVPVLRELADDARRETRIHVRGDFRSLADAVEPGVPDVFPPIAPSPETGRVDRLALARWLASPENPLTARVQMNRLWEQLFGVGLVETSEDFGTQGAPPTHPRLLDWLANDFVESNWSWKTMCKTVMTSAAYRRDSGIDTKTAEYAADPNNRLLWRGPRHRLDAEMVRDQALALAGLLSPKMYGPPVFPPQPDGVWAMVYSGETWKTAEGEDRWRRGLYTFWRRTSPYPSMVTFDAPSREVCVSRRIRTNTPLQALVTLNDPAYVEAAQALARRIADEFKGGVSQRAADAFALCTGRPATEDEVAALVELYRSEVWHYSEHRADAERLTGIAAGTGDAIGVATEVEGDDAVDGDLLADLAAWTVVANVLLNLDEVLVKA